jgi:uncharacterized protein (TIGR02678 family)
MSAPGHRYATDISDLELGEYQRAVRLLLRHPVITGNWPDARALPRIRRFAATLRRDLTEAFGYRLELHGAAARLVRTKDLLDPTQPALTRTGRPFDRQRYAYLALSLAVLGRAGAQVALSELAESVAADAGRIPGLGLDPDRGADRRAFVDAVGWLEERGALRTADGSSAAWASDPGTGEALYDIARDVALALFRPSRALQHVETVAALLDRSRDHDASSANAARRAAAQAARRAVVERPVVYFTDVDEAVVNHLRGAALADRRAAADRRARRAPQRRGAAGGHRQPVQRAVPRHRIGGTGGGAAGGGDGRPGHRPRPAAGQAAHRACRGGAAAPAGQPDRHRPAGSHAGTPRRRGAGRRPGSGAGR